MNHCINDLQPVLLNIMKICSENNQNAKYYQNKLNLSQEELNNYIVAEHLNKQTTEPLNKNLNLTQMYLKILYRNLQSDHPDIIKQEYKRRNK